MNRALATIGDVARLAGVSPATVSRAFNSPALLEARTLERVRQAAARLDYRPQGLARSLRSRRSLVVGILIPSLRNTYFAETVERVQALLAERGYTVLIASSRYDGTTETAAAKAMASQGVDALLLVGRPLAPATALALQAQGVPVLRAWVWSADQPCVGFDHDEAMRQLVRHLLALGHRRFALVAPFVALQDLQRSRETAVRQALADAALALPAAAVIDRFGFGMADGRAAWAELTRRGQAPTAVICSNDQLAAGVILQARGAGLRVPQDLSVSGYNDQDLAAAFDPPITSVATPAAEHAARVVEALASMMAGVPAGAEAPLPTRLVPRASTGPAPA